MIKNPGPNTPKSRKAKKYVIEQLLARGFKKIEIADRLEISRKTVYNILKLSI
jgi:putative transposase